jgi:carboxyl-terminal processing protease
MRSRKIVSLGAVLLVAGIVLGMQINAAVSEDNTYQYLKKLEKAFLLIREQYVEEVDSAVLSEHAIEGMLKGLDPHSVYINAENMRRVSEEFNASFEGIGIQYEFVDGPTGRDSDTLTVVSVIPGGPSEEAGLSSGDRIIAIDGRTAVGFTSEDVQRNLKGPRGTRVDLTVKRPGYPDVLEFTITRDEIPLFTLDSSYMIDEETGYIRLNRFARTTHSEFISAVTDLKAQGMQRLILDLRGNAGGYMDMAIRISDEFLGDRQMIVSARGRRPEFNQNVYARSGGAIENNAVIVLVDEMSASASEIVAGALQDHDRALILGQRTFGKGLVQKQYALSDSSVLRMTISRYYTPSGRLIQTPYSNGDREDYYREKTTRRTEDTLSAEQLSDLLPDSLKFRTTGGRLVFGGGGILPDVMVRPDSASLLLKTLVSRNIETNFVRAWLDRNAAELHRQWDGRRGAFLNDFTISDETFNEYLEYASAHGVHVVDDRPEPVDEGDGAPRYFTRDEVEADRYVLATRLKGRIAMRIFDRSAWYPITNPLDRVFVEAMSRWAPAEQLSEQYGAAMQPSRRDRRR